LIRGRIPTVVKRVTTLVTPGACVGVLVTDHGIAVNPNRPDVEARLRAAGLPVMTIQELYERAVSITGVPDPSNSSTGWWASSATATGASST